MADSLTLWFLKFFQNFWHKMAKNDSKWVCFTKKSQIWTQQIMKFPIFELILFWRHIPLIT